MAEPFDEVRTIAVLRGGGLGDLVFTLPALDALRRTYPAARIVLFGTPAHRALLADRPGPVDRVEVLPAATGVYEPPHGAVARSAADFEAAARALDIDLACQLHGGGRYSNPFLLALRPRHSVGTATPDAAPLERTLSYVYYQHEVARWLEVAGLAGAPTDISEPRLEPTAQERELGAGAWTDGDRPLVVLHPGASDPRRRWPIDRFADIARRAAADGMAVIAVGDGEDVALADAVAARAGHDRVVSAGGRLSLPELMAMLGAASVFVGNDSGPRHLAQAVGTPTVGLFWVGNVINGAPLSRGRHRVEMSWVTACPICGRDVTQVGWTAARCAHDPSLLTGITADSVYDDLRAVCHSRP
ncbi:glycosyltransferase family 9 protein [Microbacterium horticulturae]|uniref:Glycosyltransferase family 9 protein n=1 Tax=Microbacterium horticulturae TaxID=3028316 RepID=A0ABY8C178_9MICO|nr:glycosyltransferase family 9 protein [Microbacterium sp. KACC 23027]WEG09497.1 glycosyltransferase family 9 protein [Microbacterium sp. KACC 23027]